MQGGYRQPCIVEVGNLDCDGWHRVGKTVHSTIGISPCVLTKGEAKYVELECRKPSQLQIKQGTKKGFIELDIPGVFDNSYPNSKVRRGRVQEGGKITPTLVTSPQLMYVDHIEIVMYYRIRCLTEKECWRLMGCSDEDFAKAEKYTSKTQLYKQAGNSIVVPVLEGIFKQLFMK